MSGYQQLEPGEKMLLRFQAEEFLFAEADLLDSRQYDQWLELLAHDIHYWMPSVSLPHPVAWLFSMMTRRCYRDACNDYLPGAPGQKTRLHALVG